MALLKILEYPDPLLNLTASPIVRVNTDVLRLADNMAETMYNAPGVGLAAIQVDAQQRLIVVDVSENKNELLTLINPEIIEAHGVEEMKEGCLSVPDVYELVRRAERVKVRATDLKGKILEIEADGLLAVCLQHEIDHLNGRVFVEHLSRLKQHMIRKKLTKQRRVSP